MNENFDFRAMGYTSPGDWARLHDLIPADLPEIQRQAFENGADTKDRVCDLLTRNGVQFDRVFIPGAARVRNVSAVRESTTTKEGD